MNKLVLLLVLLLHIAVIDTFGQSSNQNDIKPKLEDMDPNLSTDKDISVQIPVDPKEIIGLEGYNAPESTDTLRWVAATQSLAYTIYFENDAELAMAAASASRFHKSFMVASLTCVHDFMLEIPLAHCVRGGIVPPPFGIKPPKKTQFDSNL